jgi:hypothetical protein
MKTRIRLLPNGNYAAEYQLFPFLPFYSSCFDHLACTGDVMPVRYSTEAEALKNLHLFCERKRTEANRKAVSAKYKPKYFTCGDLHA